GWEKKRQARPGSLGTVDLQILALKLRGRHDEALALLEKHVQRDGAKPEELVSLITYLGSQKRVADALGRCAECRKKYPPEVADGAAVAMLRAARPDDKVCAEVEKWLQGDLQRQPSTLLLLHLADLEDLRGNYQEAAALYDQIIRREPT